ncbi:helix-turn-helix domain-containing protein [Saccharicrinis sp. FJH2]|uniref:helix-turn-helix domain-containing protein n=1 Tax=unclassified Saccharicrinis TaxID=2646859 RepID=UPI0035D49CDF
MTEVNEYFKYLTISDEDRNWGVHLNVTGFAMINPGIVYPPSGHPSGYFFTWERGRVMDEYQINYITEGSGIIETRHGTFPIIPGTIIVIRPGEWHRYRPSKETGWKEHYVGFQGEYADHIFSNGFFHDSKPVIHIGFQDQILKSFYSIFDVVRDEKAGYQQVASGILIQLLGSIISCVKNKDFEGKDIERKIRKARLYFRDNLNKNIDVEELAAELNIGYSYFRRMFKKFTGISPVQYHLMLRLQRAKDLLVSTDMSVKEIALGLGFQSIFYFTRIFKKKMGVPPTDLRKKL